MWMWVCVCVFVRNTTLPVRYMHAGEADIVPDDQVLVPEGQK